jgi:hypothetical protein
MKMIFNNNFFMVNYLNQVNDVNLKVLFFLIVISVLYKVLLFSFTIFLRIENIQFFPINFYIDIFPAIFIFFEAIFSMIIVYIGLYLGNRVGLGAPLLEKLMNRVSIKNQIVPFFGLSVLLGGLLSVTVLLFDFFIFSPFVPTIMILWKQVPMVFLWLVPFNQDINTEIFYRLFLMTLFVWVLSKIQNLKNNEVSAIIAWISILAISLITGVIASFQGTYLLTKLQYITLSCIGSIIFGWLYWRKGIESAIIAHCISSVFMILVVLML